MEVIRFQADEVYEVALKYPDGKPVEGRFGDQVLFTTTDDRVMYLDPPVATQIKNLRIARGELIQICKRSTKRGSKRSIDWEVKRVYPEGKQPGAAPSTEPPANGTAQALQQTATSTTTTANGTPSLESQLSRSIMKTQADDAVITAIDACAKGSKYAALIGFPITFEHEDVRSLAISILIGMQQAGGHR
jgi:hypothetical protein